MRAARILYVIDDASRNGGAHIASRLLICKLRQLGALVDVLCETPPTSDQVNDMDNPIVHAAPIPYHSVKWLFCGAWRRFARNNLYPNWMLDPLGRIRRIMKGYDVVCVMSECSIFRSLVSELPHNVRKVQLIHINYDEWLAHSPSGRAETIKDCCIYPQMDVIGVVGEIGALQFKERFLFGEGKVSPFYNLIPEFPTKDKADKGATVRLVTLGRIEDKRQKDGERMLKVAEALKEANIDFTWQVYGCCGESKNKFNEMARARKVGDRFEVHGFDANVQARLFEADLMVLLSHFEGLPNVIYESMMAWTPVFSTNVGGISEQITEGENGWLAPDDDDMIIKKLAAILHNPSKIHIAQCNLVGYRYDNEKALKSHLRLLGINRHGGMQC